MRPQDADSVIDGHGFAVDPQNLASAAADFSGEWIDRQAYGMPVSVAVTIQHNNANAGDSFDYVLQQSSDGATADADNVGAFDTISDDPASDTQVFDLTGAARYVRVHADAADITLGGASVDVAAAFTFVGAKETQSIG